MIQSAASGSTFVLYGAREMLAVYAGAGELERQITALESAVGSNPGLAFDLAKTLVECVCKTVLNDHNEPVDDKQEMPRLFHRTLAVMQLATDGPGAPRLDDSLKKAMGGLHSAIQGLCELRNQGGLASHGKDAYTPAPDVLQAEFAARAADTIVLYLFRLHRRDATPPPRSRLEYGDQVAFNDWVDENNDPVAIFDLEYRPSEVLFQVDPEAYQEKLVEYQSEAQSDDAA